MTGMDRCWQDIGRLLVMRMDNLGDVIMAGPALRAIRETLPTVDLTLMTSPAGQEAALLLPWVDHVLPWRSLWQDMGDLPFDPAREYGLVQTLQARRYDAAVILTSFSQSPLVAAYACYLAGIPLRLGEPKDFGGAVLSDTPPSPSPLEMHQVERNLRLVETVGMRTADRALAIDVPARTHVHVADLLHGAGIPTGAPFLLLAPWTSCQARTYTRFGEAGRLLRAATGLPLVIAGATAQAEPAARLLEEIGPGTHSLVGRTSFAELAALVSAARLLVTNNTATMHLAAATRTPQVILFAGTELEEQWAPREGERRVLRQPTLCQPCFQLNCPSGLACLDIAPEQVAGAALDLLAEEPAAMPALRVGA
jgi:ADP-heptose:LPS heptosyltransferase